VVGNLITIEPSRQSLGKITIREVASAAAGTGIRLRELKSSEYRIRVNETGSHFIEGATPRETYDQILDWIDNEARELPRPLVSRVLNPAGAEEVPDSDEGWSAEDQDSFDDLVDLWQRRSRLKAMPFNHGERIFERWDTNVDQFDRAISALIAKEDSSRSVIGVFDARIDDVGQSDQTFPAFCLIQFMIVDHSMRVVGYFRKQEMRYWWRVNLAELARLQRLAVSKFNGRKGSTSGISTGEITTITAIPTSVNTIPPVALLKIDRLVDEDPGRLLRMALLSFEPSMDSAEAALADWHTLADECSISDEMDPDGSRLPVLGLQEIHRHLIDLVSSFGKVEIAGKLADVFERAVDETKSYRNAETPNGADDHPQRIKKLHERILELVDDLERNVNATAPSMNDTPESTNSADDRVDDDPP
jgi:hypothetical protein